MAFQTIDLLLDGPIARLTLRRPEAANAIDPTMAEELWHAAIACEEAANIRTVLITGAGRFFCVGGDLGSFVAAGPAIGEQLSRMTRFIHGAYSKFSRMAPTVVVAVNGPAAGAGLSLALLGDVILAANAATFTTGYVGAGLTPDGGSTFVLPRLIGLRRAQEMILLNRKVSATEALDWGLVTRVVENDQLLDQASKMAEKLALGPFHALATARSLLLSSASGNYEAQMELEAHSISAAAKGAEGQEGINAFLGKRSPNFLGLEIDR